MTLGSYTASILPTRKQRRNRIPRPLRLLGLKKKTAECLPRGKGRNQNNIETDRYRSNHQAADLCSVSPNIRSQTMVGFRSMRHRRSKPILSPREQTQYMKMKYTLYHSRHSCQGAATCQCDEGSKNLPPEKWKQGA